MGRRGARQSFATAPACLRAASRCREITDQRRSICRDRRGRRLQSSTVPRARRLARRRRLAIRQVQGFYPWLNSGRSYRFATPRYVQTALAFFIGFGGVEVVPLVGQTVLLKIRFHFGV